MGTHRSAIAVTVLLLLGSASAVHGASFVQVVSTRTRTSPVNSSIAATVPSSGVAAGDSLVVTLQVGILGGAVACSDPVNGAYAVDVVTPATGAPGIAIVSKHNVGALGFGASITCTYPVFSGASSMGVYEFSGLEGASPLDQTAQAVSASSGAASSGLTAATSQERELVFGFLWLPSVLQSFVPATSGSNPVESPYAPPWATPFSIGTQKTMHRFVNSIRQYEANGTVGGAGGWIALVATYRLAPDLCENLTCDDGNPCTADSCDPATGVCTNAPRPAGTACGSPSSGLCDAPDQCDGLGTCQTNHVADGTICVEADGDCDIADTCFAGACQDNGYKPQGTACGDPNSTQCDAADSCDEWGWCLANLAPDGAACGDAGSECVNADACLAGACHDNGFRQAGNPCGDASSGECDGSDSCDGSGACLSNHLADGTACGDAGTECTNQDTCAAGSCQDNGYQTAGQPCGDASSGVCNSPDSCDGSGACSANHASIGTPCSDGNVCTTADACDVSGQCAGVTDELCVACLGNTAPIVDPAVAASPSDPFALGKGTVTVTASFADSPGQARTCTIDWGDESAPDVGAISEPTATDPGSCTGTHLYTAVGVYTVSITVTDPCGESASAVYEYAVVFDPSAGFVTGGGWFLSPAGAYVPNPALTGKAFFGFVSGYFKGNASVPTGRTDFHLHAANFNFSSKTYEWLVASGSKARFRGTGEVNGAGRYGFALTAWDGQSPGGGGIDRFRIRIWDQNAGDALVYDNQIVCPHQGENADPCIGIGGGSIVIHKK